MRKVSLIIAVALLVGCLAMSLNGEESDTADVSADRWLGLGINGGDYGVGIGARYWTLPSFAVDGFFYISSWEYDDERWYDFEGNLSGVYRVVDQDRIDFLTLAGLQIRLDQSGLEGLGVSIMGGAEWSSAAFPQIAWSVCAGLCKEFGGGVDTALEVSVHYYFPPLAKFESTE